MGSIWTKLKKFFSRSPKKVEIVEAEKPTFWQKIKMVFGFAKKSTLIEQDDGGVTTLPDEMLATKAEWEKEDAPKPAKPVNEFEKEKTPEQEQAEAERKAIDKLVSELPASSEMAHLTFAQQVRRIASSNPDKADDVRSFLSKMTSGKDGTLTELRNKYKLGMDIRKMVQKNIDRQNSAANNLNKSAGNNQKVKAETKAKTLSGN